MFPANPFQNSGPKAEYKFIPDSEGRRTYHVQAEFQCGMGIALQSSEKQKIMVVTVTDIDSPNPGIHTTGLLGMSAVYDVMRLVHTGEWKKLVGPDPNEVRRQLLDAARRALLGESLHDDAELGALVNYAEQLVLEHLKNAK